jgi:hypothetical protein
MRSASEIADHFGVNFILDSIDDSGSGQILPK